MEVSRMEDVFILTRLWKASMAEQNPSLPSSLPPLREVALLIFKPFSKLLTNIPRTPKKPTRELVITARGKRVVISHGFQGALAPNHGGIMQQMSFTLMGPISSFDLGRTRCCCIFLGGGCNRTQHERFHGLWPGGRYGW